LPIARLGHQSTTGAYRPDIDGLRAISILLVVGYHAQPWLVPGGFIGVDIFFVISGFLITRIILSQVKANTFSFMEFYSRRIRRIFPALIVVLAVTYLIGWFVLLPDGFSMLGKSIAAGVAFVSNLFQLRQSTILRRTPPKILSCIFGRWVLRNNSIFSGHQLFCSCSGRSGAECGWQPSPPCRSASA